PARRMCIKNRSWLYRCIGICIEMASFLYMFPARLPSSGFKRPPQPGQIGADLHFKPGAFAELLAQRGSESGHLVGEGLAVLFLRNSPHVAARGEHVVLLA